MQLMAKFGYGGVNMNRSDFCRKFMKLGRADSTEDRWFRLLDMIESSARFGNRYAIVDTPLTTDTIERLQKQGFEVRPRPRDEWEINWK